MPVKLTMRKLLLLITYAVVLVAFIVKIDVVLEWAGGVLGAFRPIFIGFVMAFILNRPCNFFARLYGRCFKKRASVLARPLAIITAYIITLGVIAGIVAFIIPALRSSIETFAANLSTYSANLQSLYDTVVNFLELEHLQGLDLSGTLSNTLNKLVSTVLDTITTTLPHLVSAAGWVVSFVVTVVLSLVFSIYMLFGGPRLVNQIRRLTLHYLPEKISGKAISVARLTANTFTQYISGQVIEACILGVLCFIGMTIFRFSYAPLISVIIAVSALIPIAGAYLGAILSAVLLLMVDPMEAVWFIVFLLILQQLEGNLIYPRVVGTSIGLPGIWVLAAVTVGGTLMGFAGLIAGVPITAVLYTLIRSDLRRREEAAEAKTPPPEEKSE